MPSSRANQEHDAFQLHNRATRSEIDRALARAIKLSIRTHIPSTMVAYDPATQTCTCLVDQLIVVSVPRRDLLPPNLLKVEGQEPNLKATLQPIQLSRIPVAQMSSNLGHVHLPIGPGSTGLLHVCDRSIEAWLINGKATDPILSFVHALKDAVWAPTLRASVNPIAPPPDPAALQLEAASVKVGALAFEPMVKATTFIALMDTAIAAAIAAALPNDGGTAALTALQGSWNGGKATINATKGKVE